MLKEKLVQFSVVALRSWKEVLFKTELLRANGQQHRNARLHLVEGVAGGMERTSYGELQMPRFAPLEWPRCECGGTMRALDGRALIRHLRAGALHAASRCVLWL